MTNLVDVLKAAVINALLLLISRCSDVTSAASGNTTYNTYKFIDSKGNGIYLEPNRVHTETEVVPLGSDNMHAHEDFERVEIIWLNSTIDSISIQWQLSAKYKNVSLGFIKQSRVEYFPTGGRFTSHPLHRNIREYTFNNLDAGFLYTVCVYMTEVYGESNMSIITHSKCLKINTIEYIRKESVVLMMISLGYYVFMGLLGYTQWKRKQWAIERRCKNRAKADDSDVKNVTSNCTMRWKDLAEKERLVAKPGCSIEYNDT